MHYLEDIPASRPNFDFDLVAQALVPIISEPRQGATILGLHGDWGVGKTTLLNAISNKVALALGDDEGQAKYISVNFNAWKYQDREALWRALILRVVGKLREEIEKNKWEDEKRRMLELESFLYRAFEVKETGPWQINWRILITELLRAVLAVIHLDFIANAIREAGGWLSSLFLGNPKKPDDKDKSSDLNLKELTGVLERTSVTRHIDQVQSIEQFVDRFQELVALVAKRKYRLFIFVDDLDRCLPEEALQIFEAIKLFLDAPGCAYVVALDRDVIRKGLAVRYGRPGEYGKGQNLIDPDQYIEKTISLSFDLPRLGKDDVLTLIDGAELPRPLSDGQKLLIFQALGPNPRRVKRFMNAVAVQLNLAAVTQEKKRKVPEWLLRQSNEDDWKFTHFIKIMLLSYRNPALAAMLIYDFALLTRVYKLANDYETNLKQDAGKARKVFLEQLETEPQLISALRDNEDFWRLLVLEPTLSNKQETLEEIAGWFRKSLPVG